MADIPAVIAGDYDLVIAQGSDFAQQFTFTVGGSPIDFTSSSGAIVSVAAKVRATFDSTSDLVTFTAAVDSPATDGKITISLTNAQTEALTTPPGTSSTQRKVLIGYWDLEISQGTKVYRYLQGSVYLTREVTK